MVYKNNAGRLDAGFISVCLETRWLGQKTGLYVPEPPCTTKQRDVHTSPGGTSYSKRLVLCTNFLI